jgi:hypothetical protein
VVINILKKEAKAHIFIENQQMHQNDHIIVMSSQTLLHVSAYQRQKGNFINLWETFHIQQLHHLRLLIDEQQQHELNPLYTLGRVPQQSTASSSG